MELGPVSHKNYKNPPCGIPVNVILLFCHFFRIIFTSADQIMQGEMDIVSYRVLGYLLLGVVRIYSVKVDYVLHHCDEMIKIQKFKISREDIAHVETLRMSVTIPERLELDAFELDVLEDANG